MFARSYTVTYVLSSYDKDFAAIEMFAVINKVAWGRSVVVVARQ